MSLKVTRTPFSHASRHQIQRPKNQALACTLFNDTATPSPHAYVETTLPRGMITNESDDCRRGGKAQGNLCAQGVLT
jgi:hypothetical protein